MWGGGGTTVTVVPLLRRNFLPVGPFRLRNLRFSERIYVEGPSVLYLLVHLHNIYYTNNRKNHDQRNDEIAIFCDSDALSRWRNQDERTRHLRLGKRQRVASTCRGVAWFVLRFVGADMDVRTRADLSPARSFAAAESPARRARAGPAR